MRNLIFSRPRDSVFVLFPSKESITPAEFVDKYQQHNTHPFPIYPPVNNNNNNNTTATSTQDNTMNDNEEQTTTISTATTTTNNNNP
eukprot:UN08752